MPDRNVGNWSKSEVLHNDTVVIHKDAVIMLTRYPREGNQNIHKEVANISTRRQLVLHKETVQLSPPQVGTLVLHKEENIKGPWWL